MFLCIQDFHPKGLKYGLLIGRSCENVKVMYNENLQYLLLIYNVSDFYNRTSPSTYILVCLWELTVNPLSVYDIKILGYKNVYIYGIYMCDLLSNNTKKKEVDARKWKIETYNC